MAMATPSGPSEAVLESVNADDSGGASATNAPANSPYRLLLFQTIDKAQSSHGLAFHQDYVQYRKYCTAKIDRLTHRSSVKTAMVHNHKFVEGVSGKRKHAYCKREIVIVGEECLWILVFQAERAWAHACELQHVPHSRQRGLKRLKKAVKWANTLLHHAQEGNHCVEESIQECRSYAAWMLGNLELEKKHYREAYQAYQSSMAIVLELAEVMEKKHSSSPEALALRDVWTTRAETLLRPLVRFCGYEARGGINDESQELARNNGDDNKLKEGAQDLEGAIVLAFRNRQVALDAYQELAVLYLKMEENLRSDSLDEDTFLKLSTDLDDAIRIVQTEYKHYESLPSGPAVKAKRDELEMIRQYFEYQKLDIWRRQQESRLAATQDENDLLHVYDTLLQNAVSIAELQDSQGKQDDPLWLEAQAHVLRFRAFRCFFLARHYEIENKIPQAIALFQQALKLTQRAQEEVAACDGLEGYLNGLEDLLLRIRAASCRMEAMAFLQANGSHSVASTNRPLWMRLNDWDDGNGVLADSPPAPMPIPCKPTFFDVAWQHVPRVDATEELAEYIATNEPRQGFFDWLRGRT